MIKQGLIINILYFIFFFNNNIINGEETKKSNHYVSPEFIKETYQRIRNISLDTTKLVCIDTFILQKDAAEFIFESGNLYFLEPVSDKVVAAFFQGKGVFRLSTNNKIEMQQIRRFTDQDTVELDFEKALFFFTDSTYEQIATQQQIVTQPIDHGILIEVADFRKRIRERFTWNTDARILSDLITIGCGQLFHAYFQCADEREFLFIIDPFDEEEVTLLRYEKIKFSTRATFETWYSAHMMKPLSQDKLQIDIKISDMDVTIDSRKMVKAGARLEFVNLSDNMRIVPMQLAPVLRVETVIFDKSDTCFFIQEDKKEDAQLWVAFPDVLEKQKTHKISMIYSGDGIIDDVGGDNFVVDARESWFPSFYTNIYDPRRFVLKFAVPREMVLISTGKLLKRWHEGDFAYSQWDSESDQAAAGFNYGKFSVVSQKTSLGDIECYTNIKLSDDLLELRRLLEENKELQAASMIMPQELTTERMGKNAAIEGGNAYEIYIHFFGDIPIRNIRISQQPQISFGQSWPSLIYLPFTAFFDESLKERLGLIKGERSVMWYETLASHEIAHQWWGHTVLTASYHDEWLSEGFATYAAALYLQVTKGTERFKKYMEMMWEQILAKSEKNKSASELGPIWLGDRLSSFDTPIGWRLIYAKGAYVIHMLRMMLFDYKKKSDERFIEMMKDYVHTYTENIASTADFKRLVEKHFGQDMNWFFEQWVYGTGIPYYKFDYRTESPGDGEYLLTITAQQRGVSPSFRMPMHFVINFENGHAVVEMLITGSEPMAKQFKLSSEPKSIEANPWHSVLCQIVK